MKIMFITNCKETDYDKPPISWNFLPYRWKKKGIDVLGVGKYDLHKFYFMYRKFKPDIIVTSWVPAAFIPVFFKKIGLIGCPIVHRWEDYYTEMMTNYPRFLVRFMESFSAKNADYIITILKTIEKRAKDMGKIVFLLPYGIVPGNKKTKINLNALKTKKNNLKVVYAGSQEKWKRVDRIVQAVKGLDCDLFLFGGINPELQKLADDHKNIHFMGYVNPEEIMSVLKQADILVNTADTDTCMKLLDYAYAKKPILSFKGRSQDLFRHSETSFLTKDFRKGLAELIKNKKLREKLAENLKKIRLFSWDEVADIHLELYKKIINKENLKKFETGYYHVQF